MPRRRGMSTGHWEPLEVQQMLRVVAQTGCLQEDQLERLRGKTGPPETEVTEMADVTADVEASDVQEEALVPVEEEEAPETPCTFADMLLLAELCKVAGLSDYVGLGQLADRLIGAKYLDETSIPDLLRLATSFSVLGVLHQPLFTAMTKSILSQWPDSPAGVTLAEITQLARACAAQRFRQEELFGRLAKVLRNVAVTDMSAGEALSLLHSFAFLRLGPQHGELDEDVWQRLEERVRTEDMSPEAAMKLCHVLFLAKRVDSNLNKVVDLLSEGTRNFNQQQRPLSVGLHRRLLLLRSAMRYLHHQVYKELPDDVLKLFRKAHRMEPPLELKESRLFVRKLSHVLTKLKIGHMTNADRGPFTFDIVERDRKVVYECNHFDRFYASSTEKIASMCLQERIVKAMGYRVVQVPHWHWNKIRHRKQRIEYIRMSRYYALKDRRELVPRDEEVQDVAVNELDFMGEYFFRKDAPQTHFAWFQPRYDAKLRIPGASKASGTL